MVLGGISGLISVVPWQANKILIIYALLRVFNHYITPGLAYPVIYDIFAEFLWQSVNSRRRYPGIVQPAVFGS